MIEVFTGIEVYDALVEGYEPDEPRPEWWDDEDEQDWHDQWRTTDTDTDIGHGDEDT